MSSDLARHFQGQLAGALPGAIEPLFELLNAIAAGVFICDMQGRVTAFNDAAAELWLSRPELGKDFWNGPWKLFTPDDAVMQPDESPISSVLTGDQTVVGKDSEIIIERHDGSRRWVLVYPEPIFDAGGKIAGAVNLLLDITQQREGEKAQSLLAAIVQSSDDAIISKTLDGQITSWNDGAQRIFGYTAEEIVGKSVTILIPEDRQREEHLILEQLRRGQRIEHFETIRRAKDGRLLDVSITVSPLRDSKGRLIGASKIARDISVQKHAAEAKRRSEGLFRMMGDAAPVMIWMSGIDKRCSWFNKHWLSFTGRKMDQEIGCGWTESIHPDDLDRYLLVYTGAFDARRAFAVEYRLKRRDGVYRWLLDHGVPLSSAAGEFSGFIGSCVDVTEQVLARQTLEHQQALLEDAVRERTRELEDSHQRLRLSERMASLGTLSAGIGHDMGNLLVPVRVSIDILAGAKLAADLQNEVDRIRTSAHYLQHLAGGLRIMAMDPAKVGPPEPLRLKSWWEEVGAIIKNALPRGVQFELEIAEDVWARVSRPALTQVVFNLVQNAGEAVRGSAEGRVRIFAAKDDGRVRISIEDNGPGMSEEVLRRCMEPFYTTKTRSISTGLGLVLVGGIVREAGGTVAINSSLGHGSAFVLHLPEAQDPATSTGVAAPSGFAIVDIGDPRMRSIVTSELRRLGFEAVIGVCEDARVAVVDTNSHLSQGDPGVRRTVLLASQGTSTERLVQAIGERPKLDEIRKAIKAAAERPAEMPAP